MNKIKKLIAISIFLCGLFACSTNKNELYGIRYTIDDNQWITIKLDDKQEFVYSLIIVSKQSELSDEFETLHVGSVNDNKKASNVIFDYSLTENNDVLVYTLLDWSKKEFSFKENQNLIDYIGLNEELSDENLTLNELLESNSFRYSVFFDKGDREDNISFTGDELYTFGK